MTAISARRATAFLRGAALLAGTLALVAGILGMHIMTGTHAMPAPATGHNTGALHAMPASATGHDTGAALPHMQAPEHRGHFADITAVPGTTAAPGITHAPGLSCADTGGCTMISAMGGNCVPSPGNTPLEAPPPGTTPLTSSGGPITGDSPTGYGFIPRSPSPGQLSISRT
ncbi:MULTISPECIES: hypothetical protein [unclassified Arthrobacter]|uniref:hypothetical protein n=1 Tax=unclassified Arthrobacter TaxID=235627 RepID=UPI001CFFC76D|nr:MULTISPECIES: hypothetical protein [unclassified Arthrobacter]MCB5282228.1 hypothetical protein [Arthrobacter sp. ES1]WGZ80669.1 hypothetical protein QI450_05605 [Arthrobacter sp. EM1]